MSATVSDPAGIVAPEWVTGRRLDAPWLESPGLAAVAEALGGLAFPVGGCVRNTLLGEAVSDIDLATPLRPEAVAARLEAAGLKAVPTGIEHGTVTAVAEAEAFEVTTFRADVSTDGRRATVAFSTDMATDAARRDLTMNALYADPEGRVIDPLGGLPDLDARRVRFIGDPHDRIREDYLRILRFFRFTAWYGAESGIEPEGLAASAELAEGIDGLARERIGIEIRKLLSAPDPAPAMAAMAASGVLIRCLPGADPALLGPLVHMEGLAGRAPDWRLRLAALGPENPVEALRLSKADAADLDRIARASADSGTLAAAAHRHGPDAAWGCWLLLAASGGGGHDAPEAAKQIAEGTAARPPIAARDLLAAGMEPGPDLGRALDRAIEAWIGSGFTLDRAACLAIALKR